MKNLLALGLFLCASACVTVRRPGFMRGDSDREWRAALENAKRLSAAGSPVAADSALAQFTSLHGSADQATEALYWRATFRLDPAFGPHGAQSALPLLDLYLAENASEHHAEAVVLKRIAEYVDRLNAIAGAASNRAQSSNAAAADARADARNAMSDVQAQDAEIKRLRADLAKANEELELIKKRLLEAQRKGRGGRGG
jgi:hypothetical protein